MTKIERTCPRCGLVFASEKTDPLCPACLLASSLDFPDTEESPAFWEESEDDKAAAVRVFSHFEIQEELGRGGMGVVYRARDRGTGRIVALKVLQAHHLETADLVQRFRSEVRAVTSLDHPHVLPIHEVGEHEGIPFFSMKLTTGGSLAQRVGDYLGQPKKMALLLSKIARGVQHAHERGILHRDLKPGNILLDAAGEPYVCDFGLAKWIEDDQRLTVTAAVLGTPYYISPEQANGEKILTPATDIYSLGAILYELLTGRPPFVGQNVIETLRQAAEKTPERPSSIVHNISRDLETICLKCLQREPASRYATAGAFASDLENWSAGRPIQARPVAAAEQLWRWAKRNPLPASLGVVLILLLFAVAIGSTAAAVNIDKARDRAEQAEKDANEKLYESLIAQAHASRLSGFAGQRTNALEALRAAALIHPSLKARSEAIAALTLLDLTIVAKTPVRESGSLKMAFASDLKKAAVVRKDAGLELRDLASGASTDLLGESSVRIQGIAYEGDFIVVRYEDGSLSLLSASRHIELLKLRAGSLALSPPEKTAQTLTDFALSHDQKHLVVSQKSGGIAVLDINDGHLVRSISGIPSTFMMAYHPHEEKLAAVDSDKSEVLLVQDVLNAGPVTTMQLPALPRTIAWAPDGRQLAVGCADANIYLIDPITGKIHKLSGHRQSLTQVIYSRDGGLLASTAYDKTVRLWDLKSLAERVVLPAYGAEAVLKFSPDGTHLAFSDFATNAIVARIEGLGAVCVTHVPAATSDWATLVSSLDYSLDSTLLATASFGAIQLWNARTQQLLQQITFDSDSEKNLRFAHDSLLVASRKGGLTQYSISSPSRIDAVRTIDSTESFIFGSPTAGTLCLTSKKTGRIKTLAPIKESPASLPASRPEVWDAVMPADRSWIATSCSSTTRHNVEILSMNEPSKTIELPTGNSSTLTLSPDDKWLVTTGEKGCMLWQTSDWQQGPALPTQVAAEAGRAAFSPDSRMLAASVDESVYLVEIPSGKLIAALENSNQPAPAYRLRFSPDGHQLAAQGADNSLRFWNLSYLRSQLRQLNLDWQ